MVGHPWRFLDDVNSLFFSKPSLIHSPIYLPTFRRAHSSVWFSHWHACI